MIMAHMPRPSFRIGQENPELITKYQPASESAFAEIQATEFPPSASVRALMTEAYNQGGRLLALLSLHCLQWITLDLRETMCLTSAFLPEALLPEAVFSYLPLT
jgi:hypothetical protein